MKVNGNGLVEIYGEKTKERGFFCMKLLAFLIQKQNRERKPMRNFGNNDLTKPS